MSFKSSLIKTAIKLTPNALVRWGTNRVLKGIAELTAFDFNLDNRSVYVQITLHGEQEAIEVWLHDFVVVNEDGIYKFILKQAQANRPWLHNLLAWITGKAWIIPMVGPIKSHIGLINELLAAEDINAII